MFWSDSKKVNGVKNYKETNFEISGEGIMDIIRAKEIISTLADGIDPITGELLPAEHICNNPEVVRAFYTILQQDNVTKQKKTYENAGKKWTKEDDALLKQLFEQGVKVSELQKKFVRSRGSIQSRLAKLGLIDEVFSYGVKNSTYMQTK